MPLKKIASRLKQLKAGNSNQDAELLASLAAAIEGQVILIDAEGVVRAATPKSGVAEGESYFRHCPGDVKILLAELIAGKRGSFTYAYKQDEAGGGRKRLLKGSIWKRRRKNGVILVQTELVVEQSVTDNLKSRLALVASKTTNGVVITNARGQVEWVNEGFTRLTGYTIDEMRGRKPGDILQGPDTDRRTVARLRAAIAKGESIDEEILNYHRDARAYWINVKIDPLLGADGKPEGFIAIQTDVSERRRIEVMQERILSSVAAAIISTDVNGVIQTFNPEAEHLLGYRANEVVANATPLLFHDTEEIANRAQEMTRDDGKSCEPGLEVLIRRPRDTGRAEEREWTYVSRDSRRISVRLAVSAMRDIRGRRIGYLILAQDISAQKKDSLELEKSKQELEATNAQLSESISRANQLAMQSAAASVAKGMFLANMSHEIRTPINGVLGMIGLLLETQLNSEQREFAELAKVSGENLLQLVNDVLDFSKIEAGKLDLEVIDFNLADLVEESIDLVALRAQERGLEIAAVIAPGTPRLVRGDPGRIRQILVNLLSNAVKFTERGDVVLRVGLRHSNGIDPVFGFSVADTGIGIPEDRLEQLFQPFTQVDASTTRRYGGTGLGLAISRQLVELMSGEIAVQSRLGEGSTFAFSIPLQLSSASESDVSQVWSGRRILLIEPHRPTADHVAMLLDAAGARCEVATAVVAVLDRLSSDQGIDCDAVLLSDRVSGASEVLMAAARQRKNGPAAIPVVLLTSFYGRAFLSGATATLPKPVRRSALGRLMASLLLSSGSTVKMVASAPASNRGGWRILLVEDNAINQRVALAILVRLGYRADAVSNGREAVTALSKQPYDLVLMDCQMPEMDGYEATRVIRSEGSPVINPRIPIIAMTANVMEGDREACLACGMDDYLPKPIDSKILAENLARHLECLAGPVAPPAAIDWGELLKELQGDELLAKELLAQFCGEVPVYLDRARAAYESGNLTLLTRILRGMKAASVNFFAKELHFAVVEAESALAHGLDMKHAFCVLAERIKDVLTSYNHHVSAKKVTILHPAA